MQKRKRPGRRLDTQARVRVADPGCRRGGRDRDRMTKPNDVDGGKRAEAHRRGRVVVTVLHVATNGSDRADGSREHPLRTIDHAAAIAQPGDTVTVHAGEYREWVKPRRGGISDRRRITYQAAEGEHVVIKGSEVVAGWERVEGTVWKAVVANDLFGTFNPFA